MRKQRLKKVKYFTQHYAANQVAEQNLNHSTYTAFYNNKSTFSLHLHSNLKSRQGRHHLYFLYRQQTQGIPMITQLMESELKPKPGFNP